MGCVGQEGWDATSLPAFTCEQVRPIILERTVGITL